MYFLIYSAKEKKSFHHNQLIFCDYWRKSNMMSETQCIHRWIFLNDQKPTVMVQCSIGIFEGEFNHAVQRSMDETNICGGDCIDFLLLEIRLESFPH